MSNVECRCRFCVIGVGTDWLMMSCSPVSSLMLWYTAAIRHLLCCGRTGPGVCLINRRVDADADIDVVLV